MPTDLSRESIQFRSPLTFLIIMYTTILPAAILAGSALFFSPATLTHISTLVLRRLASCSSYHLPPAAHIWSGGKHAAAAAAASEEDGRVQEAHEGRALGRHRGQPVGRRRAHRDPRRHPVVRPPLRRLHRRGVRQERPCRPRRAARRRRRQPHHPGWYLIKLSFPDEHLTAVSGRYGAVAPGGSPVIRSLAFRTERAAYGPFGAAEGTPFEFAVEGGVIVGLCGRSGWQLDAVGMYVTPLRPEKLYDKVQKLGLMAYRSVMHRLGPAPAPPQDELPEARVQHQHQNGSVVQTSRKNY
ncbi:uncharacterized protein LOC125530383 isoform X3 [Triticum urartu]|uniref:uncharacterized protein LOC125530383 isoform X3 n=1 Tax=Triticum urartu TaxID=4572 RepID=UPI00204464CC|nr:uncharacterized protein LOC125530383 isoform X3 [Triticum urartu]